MCWVIAFSYDNVDNKSVKCCRWVVKVLYEKSHPWIIYSEYPSIITFTQFFLYFMN